MLFDGNKKIWLYSKPVDMRKAITGLSAIVVDNITGNLTSGELFIFYNKSFNLAKILFWNYNGFCLLIKRLEKGTFKICKRKNEIINISEKQLYRLIEGLHFTSDFENKYDVFF